jgi:hypothetical protein
VVHGITFDWKELQTLIAEDQEIVHPPTIVEDRGRGTLIRNIVSQGKLLQYWARTGENIEVGIFFPEETHNIEYWMNLSLQLVPDAQPKDYAVILKNRCLQRLGEISNGVAQILGTFGDDFRIETRYLFNTVRVWSCPLGVFGNRVKRPLAEDPIPKDKWYSPLGLMAYTYPPIDEVHDEPTILFGPDSSLQERHDDEEVQGGKIALIAVKHIRAEKPTNGLDRMQSTFVKQVAYNQRILDAESEIAGINCDIPHFLDDMSIDEPVFVCINSSEEMKREEDAITGQLWVQETGR